MSPYDARDVVTPYCGLRLFSVLKVSFNQTYAYTENAYWWYFARTGATGCRCWLLKSSGLSRIACPFLKHFDIMLTIQGFFVLFATVIQLMILYFLMEMGRALQWRVMAEVREQHAVRRPELNRNGERRVGENVNYSVPINRNRHPTENDERQG